MRHILISIKPEYIRKIFDKEKILEIRTTCPADWKKYLIDSSTNKMFSKGYSKPDDYIVHMYCTKGQELWGDGTGETWSGIAEDEDIERVFELNPTLARLNGKVVGEFTLNEITKHEKNCIDVEDELHYNFSIEDLENAGFIEAHTDLGILNASLDFDNFVNNYGNGKPLYAWHIDDLKIYDKPKELNEFRTLPCNKPESACRNCKYLQVINTPDSYENECFVQNGKIFTRPPQSWCYVEDIGEEI